MKATTVPLDAEQMLMLGPEIDQLNEAAANGHPGMLLAQIFAGRMRVFVISEQQALAFAQILQVGVTRTAAPAQGGGE
ncbi:hypothetical protein GXW78_27590 [Roseomonas terrae]|uniref:DUF1150 family protein n=1 Tax=Neoroseomonas terrae TaxID=424799 RepID=A0ABS5ER14_9PROT|nr:hypothetical protein [Neoroseomonas terrae]MBR0653437.1 hypothetical protein [Neoroseomonas terrae]